MALSPVEKCSSWAFQLLHGARPWGVGAAGGDHWAGALRDRNSGPPGGAAGGFLSALSSLCRRRGSMAPGRGPPNPSMRVPCPRPPASRMGHLLLLCGRCWGAQPGGGELPGMGSVCSCTPAETHATVGRWEGAHVGRVVREGAQRSPGCDGGRGRCWGAPGLSAGLCEGSSKP